MINGSELLSYFLRIQITDNILNFQPFASTLLILSLAAKPLALYFFGGYNPMEGKNIQRVLASSVFAVVIASVSIYLTIYFCLMLDIFMGYSLSINFGFSDLHLSAHRCEDSPMAQMPAVRL